MAGGGGLIEIGRAAREAGLRTLADDAIGKVGEGLTAAEEIMRVIGPLG